MASVDYFLKLDTIPGESQDSKHKGEIDVLSWSFGASQGGTMASGGGGGAGKVSMSDFHFVMKTQTASPKLLLACANGEHIKKAILTCRKAGKDQQEFLIYTFTDMLVSGFQTSGAADADTLPTDQISLNFAKIEQEYKEQNLDGTLKGPIKMNYDLKSMRGT